MRVRQRSPDLPVLLLVAALTASAGLLIHLNSDLAFSVDDWDLLLHRRGVSADAFLSPHGEHIVLAPAVIYKAIQVTLGMDSITPYNLPMIAAFLATAVLLFVYLRRRVGPWLALAGTVPVLFLGSAWEDLLAAFQIGYFGSMACGLGMLLALERNDRRGDLVACGLLALSLTFSSLGIPFAAGAALEVGLRSDRLQRAYVVAVPVALFGLWWLGWGHTGQSQFSFANLATSPSYVLDGFAASSSALFGLVAPEGQLETVSVTWGRALLVGLLLAAGLRLRTLGRVPRWVWITTAIAVAFWALAAINSSFLRSPLEPRYQYPGLIFILLIAAELLRGVRPSRAALAIVLVCAGFATLSNLLALRSAHDYLRQATPIVRGGLGGLEVARDTVDPAFLLTAENSGIEYFTLVDAGRYLSAADEFGSPAYDPSELPTAPEPARVAADKVLASALELRVEPLTGRLPDACLTSPGQGTEPRILSLPSGGAALELPAGAEGRLRRYASESFPVELESLPEGEAVLEIPTDRSTEPWELELVADGPVSVCPL